MEEIIQNTSVCYFTEIIMFVACWICLFSLIKNRGKFPEFDFLILYPLASILQAFTIYSSILFKLGDKLIQASISTFILIEFLVLYRIMFRIISIPKFQKITNVFFYSFILYLTVTWAFTNAFFNTSYKVFLAQTLCMLIPTFLYFLQLFSFSPQKNLRNNPEFWIAIGCLFYFSTTIPLFFLASVVSIYKFFFLNSINYIAYSVLYLFIARAFLCSKV